MAFHLGVKLLILKIFQVYPLHTLFLPDLLSSCLLFPSEEEQNASCLLSLSVLILNLTWH